MSRPQHIGIIMDGNGRWAQAKGRPRTYGHIKGARIAKQVISTCAELKIPFLTLYAFSTENWLRPRFEVDFLFKLLRHHLARETKTLVKENIQFRAIGELERLPLDLCREIEKSELATAHCTGLLVYFAISYGSRNELAQILRDFARDVQAGRLKAEDINPEMIETKLLTGPAGELDLIIRTGGEKRLSNFLLWQAAYAELNFSDILWPDYTVQDFREAIGDFSGRERRFGKVQLAADVSY